MMIYLLKEVETTEVARDSLKRDEYMYIQYRSKVWTNLKLNVV